MIKTEHNYIKRAFVFPCFRQKTLSIIYQMKNLSIFLTKLPGLEVSFEESVCNDPKYLAWHKKGKVSSAETMLTIQDKTKPKTKF